MISAHRYVTACPVGCSVPLRPSGIVLPEGVLLRCTGCGQLVSQCSEERYWRSMGEFDDDRGTLPVTGSEGRRFRRGQALLDALRTLLGKAPRDIRLLDVGCSSGAFLCTACGLGYDAEGVEPAPRAAQAARLAGLRVHTGLLHDACFPDGAFDAVTLLEVIEHLKAPAELLQECFRILRPGGVLAVGTGNTASWTTGVMKGRWEYLSIERHGGHVSFFNPCSLRLLAERCGFAVMRIETRNVRFLEREDAPKPLYVAAKVAAEALNLPARLLGKGHDMLAFLRRAG